MDAWGVDVAIAEEQTVATACSYETGDEIKFDGEIYYVLNNNSDYVVALKAIPISANEVNTYSNDYVSQNGEYPYCINMSNCNADYSTSSVKNIIDQWASKYENDLVNINGNKSRLLKYEEVINFLNFVPNYNHPSNFVFMADTDSPEWAIISAKPYWTEFRVYISILTPI